jgi:hypothetical protein
MTTPPNRSSISLATSRPTISFIELERYPNSNEEAVVSDSSLSQGTTQSFRSTPASSFSNRQASPKPEHQAQALPPVPENVHTAVTGNREVKDGREDSINTSEPVEGERSGLDRRPSLVSEEQESTSNTTALVSRAQTSSIGDSPGHVGRSSTDSSESVHGRGSQHPTRNSSRSAEQNGDRGTIPSVNRQEPIAASFQDSLRMVYRYVPDIIALMALIVPAFFGYQTYRITQVGTDAQLWSVCNTVPV